MKKIFTFIFCALIAFTANAQIEIIKDGKVVKDGETIELFAEELELAPGMVIVNCDHIEPFFVNKGAEPSNVTITVDVKDTKEPFSWCMNGNCKTFFSSKLSQNITLKANEQIGLDLHVLTFQTGIYESYTAEVSVSAKNHTQKITIKYTYSNEATGIESTQADRVIVANHQLSYSFASDADRQLNVYGVSGRLVKSETLSQNGVVALNDLHRGVYIYEITANGKRTSAHKFVIK